MVMQRRGQVFLIAALIIASLLFALTKVSNKTAAREQPEAFYDLADEIRFETKRVLDYGVLNGQPSSVLASQLLSNYSEYIANEDVVFIYGDSTAVYAVFYQTLTNLAAISFGGITVPVTITLASQTPVDLKPLSAGNTIATVRIRGNDYSFNLQPGQNFYFVLINEDGGEQFVTIK